MMCDYDKCWSGDWNDTTLYGPACRHRRRIVARLARGLNGRTICDLGCGNGRLIFEMLQQGVNAEFSGFDISAEAVAQARNMVPNVTFGQMNLSESIPAHRVDVSILSEVLEHIEDDRRLLRDLARTTRHVVISVPGGPADKVDTHYGHFRNYHGETLCSALKESGFEVVKYFRWGFPLYDMQQRAARKMTDTKAFSEGHFDWKQKMISHLVYWLYFVNVFNRGEQVFAVGRSTSFEEKSSP